VDGDEDEQARPLPAPDEQLLVIEGGQVPLDQ
jgi:hypothetical protein